MNMRETNSIKLYNKQDKETKYLKDDQNNNNIIDKNKNGLDQNRNKSQANVFDNINDDQYNDKRWILQYAKESKSKESNIVGFIFYLNCSTTLDKPQCNTTR